ncbi:MAG TPA: DUF3047 domain-containing protein [Candidatus Manganitrophaceae bacterium]|nr:DUF3047 domain-containing protein [Candidatus Manganitrophaceae bacterium]
MRIDRIPLQYIALFLGLLLLSPLFASVAFEEHFSSGVDSSGLPKGWELKQWFGENHRIEIVDEGGNKVLNLGSEQNSFGIYIEYDFDSKQTPLLTWRWKVTQLPDGGDVRNKKKDDQAAQIYVMFPRFPTMINTRLVGYIWDTTAPKGEKVTSTKSSNTRYMVLQSGQEHLGEWITERRNVYEDYKALFGEEPPDAGGITIMIDSNDTRSSAESYFDDIRIEKAE